MGVLVAPTPIAPPCPPHAWTQLSDTTTTEDRIKALESGDEGAKYNACVARKYQAAGKNVDVSLRFKCLNCPAHQEVDMVVDGSPCETKAGNQSGKKKQTLNYGEISRQKYDGKVTILYQNAARATRDGPHVAGWGATAKHEPC